MSQKKSTPLRNFATLVYPESAPDNWSDILNSFHVPALVSPLHDCDFNSEGVLKKPHFHVLLHFQYRKSLDRVRQLVSAFGGVGCEPIEDLRGYAQYLCHLNDKDKAQYDPADVQEFGGMYYSQYIEPLNGYQKYDIMADILDFVDDNEIQVFADLVDYARKFNHEWLRFLTDYKSRFIIDYLKSRTYRSNSRQLPEHV